MRHEFATPRFLSFFQNQHSTTAEEDVSSHRLMTPLMPTFGTTTFKINMKSQNQHEQQQTPSQFEGLNFLRITSSELEPDDEALRTRILAIQPDVRYFYARPQARVHIFLQGVHRP
jgi:hypothetical protein